VKRDSATARGQRGEQLAARYLESLGWRVCARNWRGASGELDLVCEDGDTLVVVEVKTRNSRRFGTPEEAVDPRKLRRLRRAASEYLAREYASRGLEEPPCRFDLVAVETLPDGRLEVRLLQGLEPS
jgi:putative endonuclease